MRSDPLGQFELFPEPLPPDPHSASQLVIHFTLLQMRVTRISTYLAPEERERLFAEYHSALNVLERYEHIVALRQAREAEAQISRSA